MSKPREIELKFEVDPSSMDALRRHLQLSDRSEPAQRTHSIYFDTPSGKLRKHNITLRVRCVGEKSVQTVKQDLLGGAGLFDRAEWEVEVHELVPDFAKLKGTPAEAFLRNRQDQAALAPIFETIVDRQRWEVVKGTAEIEIVLDEGKVVVAGHDVALAEVELELKRGPQAALFDMARSLGQSAPLRIGVLSKSEQGFRLLAGPPPLVVKAGPVVVSRTMTASEGFVATAGSCIRHFRLNERGIAIRNGEALHQARVALRRLRSALSIFKPIVTDDRSDVIRSGLSAISGKLGMARDLDVFIATRLDEAEPAARSRVLQEREHAYDLVFQDLNSESHRRMMLDLVEWVAIGAWRGDNPDQPLPAFASSALDRFWRIIKKRGKNLAVLSDETRHEVRIAGKKLRYACDFFEALQRKNKRTKQRQRFMRVLERLQADLGNLNDLVTAHKLFQVLSNRIDIDLIQTGDLSTDAQRAGLLASAADAHADLIKAGPFWR